MILKLAQIGPYLWNLMSYFHVTDTIRKLNQSYIGVLNIVLFDWILIE